METLTIKIRNQKAFKLLQDLELLDLIQIVPTVSKVKEVQNTSDRLKGSISREEAETYHRTIKASKDEWERNT